MAMTDVIARTRFPPVQVDAPKTHADGVVRSANWPDLGLVVQKKQLPSQTHCYGFVSMAQSFKGRGEDSSTVTRALIFEMEGLAACYAMRCIHQLGSGLAPTDSELTGTCITERVPHQSSRPSKNPLLAASCFLQTRPRQADRHERKQLWRHRAREHAHDDGAGMGLRA